MTPLAKLTLPVILILFTNIAVAQVAVSGVAGGGPLSCTNLSPQPQTLRVESLAELAADFVLSCTGGQLLSPGSPIPTATFTVSLGTSASSRILAAPNISETSLLIDEPGTYPNNPAPVPGYGPGAAQTVCTSYTLGASTGGCVQYGAVTPNGVPIASSSSTALTPPANIFFGRVKANQVIFTGIPVLPPVTAGIARIFRITNVRANMAGIQVGGAGLQFLESIVVDGDTAVPINYPVQIGGFLLYSLDNPLNDVRDAENSGPLSAPGGALLNPFSRSPSGLAVLQFAEHFENAFKPRMGAGGESGLILPPSNEFNGKSPGLADYGTRLEAVFHNLPVGVRLFVSVTNLAANTLSPTLSAPSPGATDSYAVLVSGETDPWVNGSAPAVSSTVSANGGVTSLAELPIVNGSATAVWEVINADPSAKENFNFGLWASYSGTNASLGTAVVNTSLAPAYFGNTVNAVTGQASATLTIPRFLFNSPIRPILTAGPSTCGYSVVGGTSDFDTGAGSGTATVTTGPQCYWSVSNDAPWVHLQPASGTGSGSVTWSVDASTTPEPRSAGIWIAGQIVSITQLGNAPVIQTNGISGPWVYTSGIAPGGWITIRGTKLAASTAQWNPQPDGPLPTTLAGTSVSIDGIAAALAYVSPTAINALVPAGVHIGLVDVVVTAGNLSSHPAGVSSYTTQPSIYSLLVRTSSTVRYYVTAADPTTGELLGNSTADPRVARGIAPGDTIDIYATGLGATMPAFPTDVLFTGSYAVASPLHLLLGDASIDPVFAALTSPGLYQVRFTVPANTPAVDQQIQIDFGSTRSTNGVYLTIQP